MVKYSSEQLVFVDETSIDRRDFLRKKGRAMKGSRARRVQSFDRGKRYFYSGHCVFAPDHQFFAWFCRYSVLPALSQDGMIYCNIVNGSFDGEKFKEFVLGVVETMQPYPLPNSVLVMDNCRIHKHPDVQRAVAEK